MTIAHKIIRVRDFLETTATGKINLETVKRILSTLIEAGGGQSEYNILVDVRQAESIMEDEDLGQIVEYLDHHRESFRNKIAVLYAARRPAHANLFLQAARDAGFDFRFFTDYEQAIGWLHTPIYYDIEYDGELPDSEP